MLLVAIYNNKLGPFPVSITTDKGDILSIAILKPHPTVWGYILGSERVRGQHHELKRAKHHLSNLREPVVRYSYLQPRYKFLICYEYRGDSITKRRHPWTHLDLAYS